MDQTIDIIEGKFSKTIYKSDNYMVTRFETQEGFITTTGPSFDYEPNQVYSLTGIYVDHPKYGFQFSIKTIEKKLPTLEKEVVSYLSSKAFPSVGKKCAQQIYEYFGDQVLSILKENPDRIFELNLKEKQYLSLNEGFKKLDDPQNEIMFHLISNGFNSIEAQKIFSRFKLITLEVSNDNPFRFYNEVYSMPFEKVKNYATKCNFEDAENKYRESYIIYLITEYNFNTGDTYIEYSKLVSLLEKVAMNNYEEIIERCIEKHYLIKEENRVYLFDDYNDETYISNYLKERSDELKLEEDLINQEIELSENELSIKYDENQKEAIKSFFMEDTSIVVGGPGTGKTTIVKTMVEIFKKRFPYQNLIVVAPTGRAAKRLNEVCEIETKTIHSLLRWNKETNTFVYNNDNPILYDVLIIDEFSMVDNNLFACLLKASQRVKKICIIGDDNQLPSIRPGYILNDLIESKLFKTTHLTFNYRQHSGNEIIDLCDQIISEDLHLEQFNKNIFFYDMNNQVDIISLIQKDLNEGYSLDDIQVLTPMYKGEWGIENLNLLLQSTFNPKNENKPEKQFGKYTYRLNDKILQLKNRPTDDVFNGDIGILEDIDFKEKALMVTFDDIYVYYKFEELDIISLAYCMSVHKSQGSEYPVVYFVVSKNNIHMLNKNLIYTAVSRAKKKLVIISNENILKQGIVKKMNKRNTTLKMRLTQ